MLLSLYPAEGMNKETMGAPFYWILFASFGAAGFRFATMRSWLRVPVLAVLLFAAWTVLFDSGLAVRAMGPSYLLQAAGALVLGILYGFVIRTRAA